jgi:hypothetical protein
VNGTSASVTTGFEQALAGLPDGYVEGDFQERRWGSTIKRSDDGRRVWLYAEELGGTDIVSFNLYVLFEERSVLKPCEMSSGKVTEFVLGFVPGARSGG